MRRGTNRHPREYALRVSPLEVLEPRIVLASDFVFDAVSEVAEGFHLTLTSTASELQIVSSDDGTVLKKQAIADNSGSVRIVGSAADEVLTIANGFPLSYQVDFDAGAGNDEIIGPSGNSTWIVSRPGGGLLNQNIRFDGVEDLTGAAGNADTFQFQPTGSMTGTVDGGDGGVDTLVLDGGVFESVTYMASSVDAGTVQRNSDRLTYAGLEPIVDHVTSAAKLITLSSADDKATLSENGAGQLVFSSDADSTKTFVGLTFQKPSNSLSIDLAQLGPLGASDDGEDHVTIQSVDLGTADLQVLAETIDVTADATILSMGDIRLLAKKTGIKQTTDIGPVVFQSKNALLDIGTGAKITGHDVILRAEAADKSVTSQFGTGELPNELLIDPLIDHLDGLLALPIKFVSKESDARVTVHAGVSVTATGNVKVESDAIADANGGGAADTSTSNRFPLKAKSKYFSVGYVHTQATAMVDLETGVSIVATGSVAINTDGTSTALLKTETNRELGDFPSDPTGIAFSLAITRADVVSKTSVAAEATITAGKTANITAEGLKDSEAEAEVGIYNDGRAGLAFGLNFSNATIDTDVNGTVTANMNPGAVVKLEFDPTVTDPNANGYVDAQADTIRVGEHALMTGDKVSYSNRRGTSIAGPLPGGVDGLTDGDVVFVITTSDPTKIKLAQTRDRAIAGTAINLEGGAAVNSKTFTADAVDSTADTVTLDNPAFTGSGVDFSLLGSTFQLGQAVRYDVEGGTPIGGLESGKNYYVIASTNQFNLQGDLRFVEKQVFQLAESENESRAGVAIDLDASAATGTHKFSVLHVLDSGLTTGLGVNANLDTTDKGLVTAGIQTSDSDDNDAGDDSPGSFSSAVFDGLFGVLTAGYGINAGKADSGARSGKSLQTAAALGFVKTNNTVTADAGPTAVLKSNEDLEVQAKISEALQINAETSIDVAQGDDASDIAVSTAVVVGLIGNTSQATVATGADLDALRATRVISSISYPYLTRPDEYIPANLGELADQIENEGYDAVNDYLDGTLGLKSKLFNTWALSSGKSGGTAIAGSINFLKFDNVSEAIVQAGAQINQDSTWRNNTLHPHPNNSGQQVVSVEATNYMQMLNVTGVFDFKFPAGTLDPLSPKFDAKLAISPVASGGKKGGVGGAIFVSLLNNTTTSLIESGVAVFTGSSGGMNMKAEEAIMNFNFSQAGAAAGKYGVAGTVAYVEQNSQTRAQLASGATVSGGSAPNETDVPGSPLTIYAGNLETGINWAGSVAKGTNLGFGITVAINDINRDVLALIGDVDDASAGAASNINSSGDIHVLAKTNGDLWAFSVAAAIAKPANQNNESDGGNDGRFSGKALGAAAGSSRLTGATSGADTANKGSGGIAFSGDVSINTVTDNVNAFIRDQGRVAGQNIAVNAVNSFNIIAAAGAAAFASGDQNKTSAGLAGSFGKNILEGSTRAFIDGVTLAARKTFAVDAHRDGNLFSLTAGGSAAPRNGGVALTGSVSMNEIEHSTQAWISAATVNVLSGAAKIVANDESDLFVIAGSISFGSRAGFGAAVSLNSIKNTTTAQIRSGTTMTHAGPLSVTAQNANDLKSITGSLGISPGQSQGGAMAWRQRELSH